MRIQVTVSGHEIPVEIESAPGGAARVTAQGKTLIVSAVSPGGADVLVEEGSRRAVLIVVPGKAGQEGSVRLQLGGRVVEARVVTERDKLRTLARPSSRKGGLVTARSTLPGIIRRILLRAGDSVDDGTPVLTLEAMKMENEVRAEARGHIRAILVEEGQVVNAGEALAEIEVGED